MGSCSNRNDTKSERIGEYAKKVSETRDISDFGFQTSAGAKIRGELGTEKGNTFIKTIKNVSK